MNTHTYSFFIRLLYKYGNFTISILLIINLLSFITQLKTSVLFYFPILITLIIIYISNRFYFLLTKSFPFMIQTDNDKITCSKFIFNRNRVEIIYFKDIKSITGGIFEGRLSGMMMIKDINDRSITFSHRISDSSKLIAKILEKVDIKLYNQVIEKLTKIGHKLSRKK